MSEESKQPMPDPTFVRVRLRPDVRCTLQESNGKPYYQLEDPLNSRFYRLGVREWEFAKLLDGNRVLREILASLQDTPDTLSSKEAVMLVRWLAHVQLATIEGANSHPLFDRSTKRPKPAFNPMFLRVPLFNPDRLLEYCLPYLSWTLSPIAFIGWGLFCGYAVSCVLMQWDRFATSLANVLSPNNWLYLALAWVLLKAVHEFYHGLVCKKYGGQVPKCGLVFILFSPIAFVDVTSSWRFRSKWHRIYTAAGGMYVEFFVASVAALIWANTDRPVIEQICQNIITMASVSTLLFNGNFLMRFDGYYILTDLIGIQNLYTTGHQYIQSLSRRYLLGLPGKVNLDRSARGIFIRIYAVATFFWRIFFYAGLLLAAAAMFKGAGIVLASIGVLLWYLVPGVRFVRFLWAGSPNEQPNRLRFAVVSAASIGFACLILNLPWPGGVSAIGVVDYEPLATHRVDSPGFVRAIHVRPGQLVQPGQLLATLESPETDLELAEIEIAIEESKVRTRVLHRNDDVVSLQVESKKRESLERQRDELAQRVENLVIRASIPGRVISRELDTLIGQYLKTGSTVLAIGHEQQKNVKLSVAQKDVDFFLKQIDSRPQVRIKGRGTPIRDGRLDRVNPRATRSLLHPALAAPNGGPLAVSALPPDEHDGTEMRYELVEPRFLAMVRLSKLEGQRLRAGELARVRLEAVGESIGGHLVSGLRRWVRSRLDAH